MKVDELIEILLGINSDAEVTGVFNQIGYSLLYLGISGSEGCTEEDCKEVTLHFTNDHGELV